MPSLLSPVSFAEFYSNCSSFLLFFQACLPASELALDDVNEDPGNSNNLKGKLKSFQHPSFLSDTHRSPTGLQAQAAQGGLRGKKQESSFK